MLVYCVFPKKVIFFSKRKYVSKMYSIFCRLFLPMAKFHASHCQMFTLKNLWSIYGYIFGCVSDVKVKLVNIHYIIYQNLTFIVNWAILLYIIIKWNIWNEWVVFIKHSHFVGYVITVLSYVFSDGRNINWDIVFWGDVNLRRINDTIFHQDEYIKWGLFTFEVSLCIDFIIGLQIHKKGILNI